MTEETWHLVTAALVLVAVAEAVLLVGVMRQVGNLMIMVRPGMPRDVPGGPELGSQPEGLELAGATVAVFVAPGCQPCEELAPSFPTLVASYPGVELVAIVSSGEEEEREEYARKLGPVARPDLMRLYTDWSIPGTPFALALDDQGRVRHSGVVNTLDQLELMAKVAQAPDEPEPVEEDLEPQEVMA
jgi:thiol-disulfide isomerase/thioredoxin